MPITCTAETSPSFAYNNRTISLPSRTQRANNLQISPDGARIYVNTNTPPAVYSVNISTGVATSDYTLQAGANAPHTMFIIGSTIYISQWNSTTVQAYTIGTNGALTGDTTKNWSQTAANRHALGSWYDSQTSTVWTLDRIDRRVYAYEYTAPNTFVYNSARDFTYDFFPLPWGMHGTLQYGGFIFIADGGSNNLRVYRRSGNTFVHSEQLTLASTTEIYGLTGNDTKLWTVDRANDDIYEYNLSFSTVINSVTELFCGTQSIAEVRCGETLVFGGTPVTPPPVEFNPTTITLTTLTATGAPTARRGSSMAGDASSGVLFFGDTPTRQNDYYRYVATATAITVTALTGQTVSGRAFGSIVGDAESGVWFGGLSAGGTNLQDFRTYTVNTTANTVNVQPTTAVGTVPEARRFQGMDGTKTLGMIFGGQGNAGNINTFTRYSVSGNTVTFTTMTLSGTITARRAMGFAGDATAGVIFGGFTNARVNDWFKYEVTGNTVTVTALTVSGTTISARNAHAMVGDGTTGIVFGGRDSTGRLNDFYHYRVSGSTVTVTSLTVTGSITARQVPAMIGNDRSGLIFGGLTNAGRVNDFVRYVTA